MNGAKEARRAKEWAKACITGKPETNSLIFDLPKLA
jgi:hypothetical protein